MRPCRVVFKFEVSNVATFAWSCASSWRLILEDYTKGILKGNEGISARRCDASLTSRKRFGIVCESASALLARREITQSIHWSCLDIKRRCERSINSIILSKPIENLLALLLRTVERTCSLWKQLDSRENVRKIEFRWQNRLTRGEFKRLKAEKVSPRLRKAQRKRIRRRVDSPSECLMKLIQAIDSQRKHLISINWQLSLLPRLLKRRWKLLSPHHQLKACNSAWTVIKSATLSENNFCHHEILISSRISLNSSSDGFIQSRRNLLNSGI